MKGIGTDFTIKSPFKPIGALKTGCIGCGGCEYEYYGFTAWPCSICRRNMRTINNPTREDYFKDKNEKKNRKTI